MSSKNSQPLTLEQAMGYARKYCALQERCPKDVKCKLNEKGLDDVEAMKIVNKLIKSNFISEQRYAELYVRSKIHQSHWGRIKIRNMLSMKQIPKTIISKALSSIDEQEYKEILESLMKKKLDNINTTDEYQRKYQLRYHLSSHGFENELIEELFEKNNI